MEGTHLSPVTIGGAVYCHRSGVDSLVVSRDGEAAGEAFKLFVAGKGPVDVVRELKLPVDLVNRLWTCYQSMREREGRTLVIEVIELPENVQVGSWAAGCGRMGCPRGCRRGSCSGPSRQWPGPRSWYGG